MVLRTTERNSTPMYLWCSGQSIACIACDLMVSLSLTGQDAFSTEETGLKAVKGPRNADLL